MLYQAMHSLQGLHCSDSLVGRKFKLRFAFPEEGPSQP